ncbi:hypothetical protein H9Q73_000591 [Fusarium xylarioides]|nr:hypothetical protein H9Q73_000591 [Fusarium xylarioides]
MARKKPTVQSSSVPLAQRITSVSSDTRSRNASSSSTGSGASVATLERGTHAHAAQMVAWLKSRAETLDNERRSLADQLQALETRIQRDIDTAAKWQLKADELAATKAESSSIEDRFAEALRKKKEAKPEETKPEEAEAEANDD